MNLRSILTVAAAVAASSALMIAPAQASSGDAVPASETGIQARVECSNLSNGQLCISLGVSPSNIAVFYTKSDGSKISAELGFRNSAGSTTWGATKSISVNERANSTWTMSYPCSVDYKGLIRVAGQGTFETPWATC